jgi:hypothetical protein
MTSQVSFKGMHVKLVILASLGGGIVESNLSRIQPNLSLNFLMSVFPSNSNV